MQVKHGFLRDGTDNLLKALSLQPKKIDIQIKLGESYLMFEDEEEKIDDAIHYLSRALEQDGMNYDCLIGLAKGNEKKGDLDKAI